MVISIFATVDGKDYSFQRPEPDSRGFLSISCAKVCPYCLRQWARLTCSDIPEDVWYVRHWYSVVGQCCCDCLPPLLESAPIPGSLLEEPQTNCQTLDWDLLNYLPPELLLREFHLHHSIYQRLNNVNTTTTNSSILPDAINTSRIELPSLLRDGAGAQRPTRGECPPPGPHRHREDL